MRRGRVYVELQNVRKVLNPMEIYVDMKGPLTCELLDDAGKPPALAPPFGASIVAIPPYWLVLPVDSSLKFGNPLSDLTVPKLGQSGLWLAGGYGWWFIPDNPPGHYSLSGTFSAPAPQEPIKHRTAWSGVLKLPAVKIPTPRRGP